jgi:Uma2 family endonuclease
LPDIGLFRWSRLPGRRIPTQPIPDLAPDLAIEILSTSNTPREMENKRRDYFGAGTHLVWEVDPTARRVRVYTGVNEFSTLSESDTLDGGDILPGFSLVVQDMFSELDRQG